MHGRIAPPHRLLNRNDRRGMGAKAVAAMHKGDARGAASQLMRPIEGGVASADDDDSLPGKGFRIRNAVVYAAPIPRLGAGLRQSPRRERADPGGDHKRARRKTVGLRHENELAAVRLQCRDLLVAMDRLAELRGLLDKCANEILREYLWKAGHVKDVFFRIQGGELTSW